MQLPANKSGSVHLGLAIVSLHSCKTPHLGLIQQSVLTVYQYILMVEEEVCSSLQCLVLRSSPCFSGSNQCLLSHSQETNTSSNFCGSTPKPEVVVRCQRRLIFQWKTLPLGELIRQVFMQHFVSRDISLLYGQKRFSSPPQKKQANNNNQKNPLQQHYKSSVSV